MKYRPMSRCGAHTVYAVLVLLVVELTGCGAQAPTSHPGGNSAAVATSPPSPCPESPPGGSPPSPPPALGGDLKLPASPCLARYKGIADVRGLTTFTMTIGRAAPGEPYFAPTLLEGAAGESLRLHIVNTTPALHNMSVPGDRVDVAIPAGGTVDVVVTFPPRGPLVYFCSYHATEEQAGELFTVSG